MRLFPEFLKGRLIDIAVWVIFCATCLQLAFQQPYAILIPGCRANLFSGLLCALCAICVFFYLRESVVWLKRPDTWISLVLVLLVLLNVFFSLDPKTSAIRGVVLVSSGLGGYWCSRLLLNGDSHKTFFQWFTFSLFCLTVGISIVNYGLWGDISQKTPWNLNRHVVTDLIILLSFAPITMLLKGSGKQRISGIVVLCLSFLALFLSGERSAVLIPIGLLVLTFLLRGMKMRYALLVLAVMVIFSVVLYRQLPAHHMRNDHVRVFYRIEAFPFSWHIAKKHPFLGKGLLAPREKYLEDYEIRYPHVTKKHFAWAIDWARSPENLILMLMSEMGFPFLFLYIGSVLFLIGRLFLRVKTGGHEDFFPPLAVLLSIVGALVHYMVFDGLLYPQLCWFFHLLLGLIPRNP
ncbi:MAG: O-antigen ligase family protein [Deltaproteobacteria bacterium]|nr:O-antigen ligase family protein [Deltaproteobacteria bacterium]